MRVCAAPLALLGIMPCSHNATYTPACVWVRQRGWGPQWTDMAVFCTAYTKSIRPKMDIKLAMKPYATKFVIDLSERCYWPLVRLL